MIRTPTWTGTPNGPGTKTGTSVTPFRVVKLWIASPSVFCRNLYPAMRSTELQPFPSGHERYRFHNPDASIPHVEVKVETFTPPMPNAVSVTTRALGAPVVSTNGRARSGMPTVPNEVEKLL